jgi:hypothetical protein
MSDGHGGYRKPEHPASVSPPGHLSKRTDGGPAQAISTVPDQPYGAQSEQANEQRVAPMAGQAPMPHAASPAAAPQDPGMAPAYQGGGFNAPSERPGEPVTHGADAGPGAGPEVLSAPQPGAQPTGYITSLLQRMSASDTTGTLATLYQIAQQRGV